MRRKQALGLVKRHRAGSGFDQIKAVRRDGRCCFVGRVDRRWPFPHVERILLGAAKTWAAASRAACGGAVGAKTRIIIQPERKRIVVVPGMSAVRP